MNIIEVVEDRDRQYDAITLPDPNTDALTIVNGLKTDQVINYQGKHYLFALSYLGMFNIGNVISVIPFLIMEEIVGLMHIIESENQNINHKSILSRVEFTQTTLLKTITEIN